ncbi:MAG TPA: lysine--tRNA ligase [Caulobacteraceae bacterium]|nr:lysine--tRNA ligase [Caulobacteraceae bacterium]
MTNALFHHARDAKSWPFEQARVLIGRILRLRLTDEERDLAASLIDAGKADEAVAACPALARAVVFECGYGPTGPPHLGTFAEASRPAMVRQAFRALTGEAIPTRLIVVSDDMDGMRRIAPNLPNQAMLAEDLGKPLSVVRDPFETHESFAAHNNARLCAFLDEAGFEYEFLSASHAYKSGLYDATLRVALERFDAIQAIMLPTLGPERRASYSPFFPISPTTGRVLQVPTLERHVDRGTIVFQDEDGDTAEVPVTGGHVKMQWRPDWALRWTALGVDFEMSGKDLIDSVRVSNRICKVLGGEPPDGFHFELFLDDQGARISKTKGNGLTMEEWLRYGAPESLSYYMFPSPRSAKRLYFDVIPRATDEYLQQLDAYNRRANSANPVDNPVWFVHRGNPPERGSPVSFTLLLNLTSAANASSKSILWGFLSRHLPGASPATEPLLDRLCGYAIEYYEGFVKPAKRFRPPDERERAAFADLVQRLKSLPIDCEDGELIQNEVYAAGKAAGFEPLRDWFGALYEVLLGETQGPRFGSFAAIFGLSRTIGLIERALAGEDLAAG